LGRLGSKVMHIHGHLSKKPGLDDDITSNLLCSVPIVLIYQYENTWLKIEQHDIAASIPALPPQSGRFFHRLIHRFCG
jgi:hypothetical protein